MPGALLIRLQPGAQASFEMPPKRKPRTERGDCPRVRKSVRLDLDASAVVLQLSGVAPDAIAVAFGPVQ